MMRQTNDCGPVRVMQHKVDPALGPAALGLGLPGALPAGLVQPFPKPRALIRKQTLCDGVITLTNCNNIVYNIIAI